MTVKCRCIVDEKVQLDYDDGYYAHAHDNN